MGGVLVVRRRRAPGGRFAWTPPTPVPSLIGRGEVSGWSADATRELMKIPFFVRNKAKRNTERYAAEKGVTAIGVETLYEAKAHYAR